VFLLNFETNVSGIGQTHLFPVERGTESREAAERGDQHNIFGHLGSS
jgi:hypothetical protein